jgi:hypothetical protein
VFVTQPIKGGRRSVPHLGAGQPYGFVDCRLGRNLSTCLVAALGVQDLIANEEMSGSEGQP